MKDILVHVDGSERSRDRMRIALDLALRQGARLTALFAQTERHRISAVARRPSENLDRAAEAAAAAFADVCGATGAVARWWQLPHGEPDFLVSEVSLCARYFDLVVVGQAEAGISPVPDDLVEQVVLRGGCPVLVIPYVGNHADLGRRILVAWNASPEASRAIHAALPLLADAAAVTVLSVLPPGGGAPQVSGCPPVDIIDHLSTWGIAAQGEHLPNEHIGKMDMLLSRAFDLGADLLVMGAHGHDGFSLLHSSATQHLLRHMTLPVLMAH